jgi:hypothetical protein
MASNSTRLPDRRQIEREMQQRKANAERKADAMKQKATRIALTGR